MELSTSDRSEERVSDEPEYEGVPGRTRLEPVHVTIPGGFVRSVPVYRAVNVRTDPQLKEPALSGALHRFEGGEELAIPFVYHDPALRRFALVVPETLRHEELHRRARLLEALADAAEHPIPPYVREARVVIGPKELREYVERPSIVAVSARTEELDQREAQVRSEGEALTAREGRLKARAEEVTRREDDLRSREERTASQERDLQMRERELDGRLAQLRQREQEVHRDQARRASGEPSVVEVSVLDDDVEELSSIDELEPVDTNQSSMIEPEPVRDSDVELVDDAQLLSDDDVEEVDADDAELIEAVEAAREVTGVSAADRESEERTRIAESVNPAPAPPTAFLDDPSIQLAASAKDGLWLFARVDEGRENAFREGADLLAQLVVVQGHPVVVLALAEAGHARPYTRRLALDPRAASERPVLEALRRSFEATVAIFSGSGRYERTVEVSAPRRVNVALLLERIARLDRSAELDGPTAKERALSAPPPVRDLSHPFQREDPIPAENARAAADMLEKLVEWSTPEKLDRAILALSVPKDVVDGSMRQVLTDAVEHGLALPAPLLSRAVSLGVAPEPGELVERQLERFVETEGRPDRGGLTTAEVASNWEKLLEAASENEVTIDEQLSERTWALVAEFRGDPEPAKEVDADKLGDMGQPELVMLLEHPKLRPAAAIELARRGDVELLDTVYKAVRKMPRGEVIQVVPRLVGFGEAAGDAFIDGLGARKTFVRQASALALGHLRLRRAVVPLVHLLQNEPSDVWREVARILGLFGTGAFRALSRALKDPKGKDERFSYTLAHLANHGCEAQVKELTDDGNRGVALIAVEAQNQQSLAKEHSAQVAGERPMMESDKVLTFSRAFEEEFGKID
ncbi:MAG: hypothetical protein AAGF12_22920 [Myxococcota bacterium]